MFATRHGRGELDPTPRMSEQMIMTSSMGITTTIPSTGQMVHPFDKVKPLSDIEHSNQMEYASMRKKPLKH